MLGKHWTLVGDGSLPVGCRGRLELRNASIFAESAWPFRRGRGQEVYVFAC